MERFAAIERAKSNADTSALHESWIEKAQREAALIGEGFAGAKTAAKSAFVDHPVETSAKAAVGIGLGIGFAYLSRGRGLLPITAKTIGTASCIAFANDVAAHGREVAAALQDNWKTSQNWDKNVETMQEHLGQFAFDTAIMSLAGAAGSKVGHKVFGVSLRDLPHALVPQMNGKGISQDYYNKLLMAEHYNNVALNAQGKFSLEKVSRARQSLQESLNNLVTYRQYWNQEIATVAAGGTNVNEKVALNVLLHGNRDARTLDHLSVTLKRLGDQDLTDPRVLTRIAGHMQSARDIIYGIKPTQAQPP